ncbi:phosphatidylethanolamine N-methyltransferase-like [Littorina saxatilis]|uniref:phosphatidylethanolamine N-methyltransferase-like n=1 Tax=Littorina saxatilis TaxID=31220 RepID=UPI0038B501AF
MGKPVKTIFAIDLFDFSLWIAIASIIFHSMLSWNLIKWECTHRKLASVMGGSRKQAGFIVSGATFVLGVIRHSCVISAITYQPRWTVFHSNYIIVFGQLTLLAGLVLLGRCMHAKGAAESFICVHFNVYGDSTRVAVFPYNVLSEPVTVASTMIYAGLSLLHASIVGLLLSLLMGIINHCQKQHKLVRTSRVEMRVSTSRSQILT